MKAKKRIDTPALHVGAGLNFFGHSPFLLLGQPETDLFNVTT